VDTRSKILAAKEIASLVREWRSAGSKVTLVRGSFDPLLAEHARRLQPLIQPGNRIVVALGESSESILPPQPRAELVAALRGVDAVLTPGEGLSDRDFDSVVSFAAADNQTATRFAAHVRQRAAQ